MGRHVPASDTRNTAWRLWVSDNNTYSYDMVQLAVLIDIREELRELNRLLGCSNFTQIPAVLRSIRRNTYKPRDKKGPAK